MEYLTVPEVSKRLRIHDNTTRKYIKEGKLKATLTGGKYLIKDSDIDKMLEG